MAKQDINFKQGGPLTGDSGERGDDPNWGVQSIKPNTDGERAVSANFDRPPENLRKRTEVLRGELEGQKYLQDGDMRWVLSSGKADGLHDFPPGPPPPTEWPIIEFWQEWVGDPLFRWYFKLKPNIAVVVQPLNTPSHDLRETKSWEFPNPGPESGYVIITMDRRAYAGANIREVVWEAVPFAEIAGTHGTSQFLDLTLSGEDGHILTITIRDDDLTNLGHVTGAFGAWNVPYLLPAGFNCSTSGLAGAAMRMADIPLADVDYIYSETFDRELHYITAETFRDFFDASPDNLMDDGDTLSVVWGYLVNPDPLITDGRSQAIPANGNTEVSQTKLFLTSKHPEWIPLAIPLCKRIGRELLWLDGTLVTEGHDILWQQRFGENGYTVKRIYGAFAVVPIAMTSMWFDYVAPPAWATVMDALDGIVADLAGTQDPLTSPVDPTKALTLIGMPETAVVAQSLGGYNAPTLPADSAFTAILNILQLLNSKGSLDLGTFGSEETVTGLWKFSNHVRRAFDSAMLRAAPPDTSPRLVYRNAGRSDTADDIDWDTCSVYEVVDNLIIGTSFYLEVWGGYLSGVDVVSPPTGIGAVSIHGFGNADGQVIVEAYNNYVDATSGPVALDICNPTDWNYYCNMDKGPPPVPLPPAPSYFNVYGNSFAWRWYADQQVRGTIDFQEEYAGSPPPLGAYPSAEVKVASQPWSLVLDGFWADSLNLDANTIYVSPGRALVNGKPIIIDSRTDITDLGSPARHMNNVTLPTDDSTTDMFCQTLADTPGIPGYYYLWLRSDGNFFIGKLPPVNDYWNGGLTRYPGSVLYRPDLDEVHVGYTQADYCLVDVIVLWQYYDLEWYFDSVPRVGGHERRFRHRYLPSASLATIEPLIANWTGPFSYGTCPTYSNYPLSAYRSPGIPLGVTQRAKIGYNIEAEISAGADFSVRLLLSSDYRIYPEEAALLPQRGFFRSWASTANINAYESGSIDVVLSGNTAGTAGRGEILGEIIKTNAADATSVSFYLLGFYWDRNEVASYHS